MYTGSFAFKGLFSFLHRCPHTICKLNGHFCSTRCLSNRFLRASVLPWNSFQGSDYSLHPLPALIFCQLAMMTELCLPWPSACTTSISAYSYNTMSSNASCYLRLYWWQQPGDSMQQSQDPYRRVKDQWPLDTVPWRNNTPNQIPPSGFSKTTS